MLKNTNVSKLSRVDELSVRKIYIEKMVVECKKQLEDRVLLMLNKAFDEDVESKAEGQIVFLERWLQDIENEIKKL
ncbi:hypothetical protein [Clostridium botulinum]|uniref:hypothetical protein n=1 Tax=Clostridium botulinum TaxID=1491 RepID=UPI0013F03F9E|nr:hypothetical protein [Clostridium botulinum]MBY6950327.1 hypothetical protein [Clostridium botulinum]MCR1138576.1 hypothetical protein [Clostridium botulinum]NEZ80074.1 hypothetical protein [Clostridium botulinum]NFA16767.1 hypothetical protein [Clostridium botulinum]NFA54140.1 hypothetical protein [Clostridium botulinum]